MMQMTKEAILAQERDPFTAFANRVRELNYGDSYYFKVIHLFLKTRFMYLSDHINSSLQFLFNLQIRHFPLMFFWVVLQPVTVKELKKIDPKKACQYFDNCFKDPSTFTVAIVGNVDPQTALPLILQYLVSDWLLCWPFFALKKQVLSTMADNMPFCTQIVF